MTSSPASPGATSLIFEIEDAAFGLRQRLANGGGPVHLRRIEIADVRHGRGFGHAVSLVDGDAGEIGETAREFGGKRRGAAFDPADFVVGGKFARLRHLAERVDGGRDHRHEGDVFLHHQRAKFLHVEAGHQHRAAPRARWRV